MNYIERDIPEPPEHLREINKDFYIAFSSIALRGEQDEEIFFARLKRTTDSSTLDIELLANRSHAHYSKDWIIGRAPLNFKTPFVGLAFDVDNWLKDKIVDTPYGRIPMAVIGKDNIPTLIDNAFILGGNGVALKHYEIWKYDEDESLDKMNEEDRLAQEEGKARVNTVLPEEEGYMNLLPEDYELLGKIIEDLNSGEWVLSR